MQHSVINCGKRPTFSLVGAYLPVSPFSCLSNYLFVFLNLSPPQSTFLIACLSVCILLYSLWLSPFSPPLSLSLYLSPLSFPLYLSPSIPPPLSLPLFLSPSFSPPLSLPFYLPLFLPPLSPPSFSPALSLPPLLSPSILIL